MELRFAAPEGQYSDAFMTLDLKAGESKVIYKKTELAIKTRLELAHHKWHNTVAKLVSPPYSGETEELKAITPLVEAAQNKFRTEFLKDKKEAIEFISRNRLEVENFFGDLMIRFDDSEVYDAIYNYFKRNYPSKSKEEIELILKRKCGINKK